MGKYLERGKRENWINCMKFIAIFAVLVDHTNLILYTNQYIAKLSYCSVSVFIIMSGITSAKSISKKCDLSYLDKIKKPFLNLLISYCVATSVYQLIEDGKWDLLVCINHIIKFDMSAPFYFVLFYMQLIVIGPLLYNLIKKISEHHRKILLSGLLLIVIAILSALLINYTYILPVHGGGCYLFGGTYLFQFALGMMLEEQDILQKLGDRGAVCKAVFCVIGVMWTFLYVTERLPFDYWFEKFFGSGINPPSINVTIYACFIIGITYMLIKKLEKSSNLIVSKGIHIVSSLGNSTLYIFLYHLIIMRCIMSLWPDIVNHIQIMRFVLMMGMILLPVCIRAISIQIKKYYRLLN